MNPAYKESLKLAEKNKKGIVRQTKRLRKMRKGEVDKIIHPLHEKAFEKIDCLECANCCKTTSPILTERDTQRIAKHLRMKAGEFSQKYLYLDEDQEYTLKTTPCPFLGDDNYCGIYDVRPRACAEYPHTDQVNQIGILQLTQTNATICPAVANIFNELERVSEELHGKVKRKH
ncbi:MAG: YkgJ family cysteine cluster protein [Salibacteraceae bacterium]